MTSLLEKSDSPPDVLIETTKTCRQRIEDYQRNPPEIDFPKLINTCAYEEGLNRPPKSLGCYLHSSDSPCMRLVHYIEPTANSPQHCINTCRFSGLPYAGLFEGDRCFCDRHLPTFTFPRDCNYPCTDKSVAENTTCGGVAAMEVFFTGVVEIKRKSLTSIASKPWETEDDVRVVYVLFLTGRSWRSIQRMFRLLYHSSNYFYIHVDKTSEYLYSRCRELERLLPNNVHVTANREHPIWAAPGLLDLVISIMRDLVSGPLSHWQWDFLINLSETDLPIAPTSDLIKVLNRNRGKIFVKSTSGEKFSFIQSQSLSKAFMQCNEYVYELGVRPPLHNIVINGGSDWVILHRRFCAFIVQDSSPLVRGLVEWFRRVALPGEAFFHTLAYNSAFCEETLDENLRLVNWQRPRGCWCKHNSTADMCGCSPSVFSGPGDLYRLKKASEQTDVAGHKKVILGRKFDSTIDVAMINYVESHLLHQTVVDDASRNIYLESIFSPATDLGSDTQKNKFLLRAFQKLARKAVAFAKLANFNVSVCEVFALFNASASILTPDIDYSLLSAKIDALSGGFISPKDNQLNTFLPLRTRHPPDLVLRIPHSVSVSRVALEVRFRPRLESYISDRPPEEVRIGDLFYFEVGTQFDIKELVFKNYYRYLTPSDQMTLAVVWRAHLPQNAVNSTAEFLDALFFAFYNPDGHPCSTSIRVNRNGVQHIIYPGLAGFFVHHQDISHDFFAICAPKSISGRWKVDVVIKGKLRTAYFSIASESDIPDIWKPTIACVGQLPRDNSLIFQQSQEQSSFSALVTNLQLPFCSTEVWSSMFPDVKSMLGQYNAATGSFRRPRLTINRNNSISPVYSIPI